MFVHKLTSPNMRMRRPTKRGYMKLIGLEKLKKNPSLIRIPFEERKLTSVIVKKPSSTR